MAASPVPADGAPIFIGGVAGTGKTRLGARLGRHPHISHTRRTYLWRDFYGRFGDLSRPRDRARCLDAVLASSGSRRLDVDPGAVRAEIGDHAFTYAELFALLHRHHARSRGKARWCDQLGLVEAYAEPIFASLPDARVIHIVRDPREPARIDRRPGRVGWMVGKWLTSAGLAERNAARFGDRYLVLRYEEVRADEEAALRAVCGFLDEPYDPAMASGSSGVELDPEPSARAGDSSRWRFIEAQARDLLICHGYPVDRSQPRSADRRRPLGRPADRLALAAWRRVRAPSIARRAAVGT